MPLGYEVYDDSKRSFEQEGLTGEVRRYTTTSMEFPCFIICSTPAKPVRMYSLETLRMMFPKSKVYNEELANSMIHIYFNQGEQTAKLGLIQPNQVKTFLRLFSDNDVDCYLTAEQKLEGMYAYILSE